MGSQAPLSPPPLFGGFVEQAIAMYGFGSSQHMNAANQAMANAQMQAHANQQSALNMRWNASHVVKSPTMSGIFADCADPDAGFKSKPEPSVASTAASRVKKAAWEEEYDRKERELEEWIAAGKRKLAEVVAEETVVHTTENTNDQD